MFKNIKINILRPVLMVLIMFIPLYPKFPLVSVSGTYVAVRLDDLVVIAAGLILLIDQIRKGFPLLKEKISLLIAAYWLAIGLSAVQAILIFQTEPVNVLLLNTLRRLEYMSLFFIAYYGILNLKEIRYPAIALLITNIGVVAYGLGQKYFSLPVVSTMNEEFSQGRLLQMDIWTRISSTFAGHYDLAAYMSVTLILVMFIFLTVKVWWQKLTVAIIWLLSFYVLTLTASRISIFAFWGGISLMLFLVRRYVWIVPVSLLVVFSMINSKDLNQRLLATIPSIRKQINKNPSAAPTAVQLTPTPVLIVSIKPSSAVVKINSPTPTVFRHGPEEIFPPVDADVGVARSGEIRFNVEWPRAINAWKKNILLGTGLGSITLATDNDYLRLLGESGVLGLVSFLVILSYFVFNSINLIWKKGKQTYRQQLKLLFLSCLVAVAANAIFIDVFEASKPAYLFWVMMGLYYRVLRSEDEV